MSPTSDPADILKLLTSANNGKQPLVAGMGDPGGGVSYGQGRILTWNSNTFENTVAFRGGVLTNLPVLSGPDALTYRPDNIVAVMSWSPNGGASVHWIMGRVIIPGPGRGTEAISWMTSELGKRLAAAVFAERIHALDNPEQGNLPNGEEDAWYNTMHFGPGTTTGPEVQAEISESGIAIVFVSALIQGLGGTSAWMSFRIDDQINPPLGATSAFLRAPSGDIGSGIGVSSTGIAFVNGITPGIHSFRACYRVSNVDDSYGPSFSARFIMVIGL